MYDISEYPQFFLTEIVLIFTESVVEVGTMVAGTNRNGSGSDYSCVL